MHKYRIYHSDIKPANNVFYHHTEYDEYEPKLIDFGGAVTDYRERLAFSPLYFHNNNSRKA